MNLNFAIKNTNPVAKAHAILFRNTDPSFNTLELTITNEGEDLDLKGGAVIKEEMIGPGGTTILYLNAANLLACGATALAEMKVEADGYHAHFYEENGGAWAVCPEEDGKLAAGESIRITLSNIVVGSDALTGQTSLDYYNFSESEGEVIFMAVQVADKPVVGNKDLTQHLEMNWGEYGYGHIYQTTNPEDPILNDLAFTIRNNDAYPIVAGPATEFTFSFVYANTPGYGALCTKEEGGNILLKQTNAQNTWLGGRDDVSPVPIWRYKPTGTVLGTGERAIISFSIEKLASTLQAGATLMYLSWANIPGYNDGQKSLEITKLIPPVIGQFTVTPQNLIFATSSEIKDVMLEWQVQHWKGKLVNINNHPLPAKGKKKFPVKYSDDGVTMNLCVVFGDDKYAVQRDVTINTELQGPVIKQLKTDPRVLDFRKENPVLVNVSWEVENAREITFSGSFITGLQPDKGSAKCYISYDDVSLINKYSWIRGVNLELCAKGNQDGKSATAAISLYQEVQPLPKPDINEVKKELLSYKNIASNNFPFLSDLYSLVDKASVWLGSYLDKCKPAQELFLLIAALDDVLDENNPDWEFIGSYPRKIVDISYWLDDAIDDKSHWEDKVVNIDDNISRASVRKRMVGQIGYSGVNTVCDIGVKYCEFMRTLFFSNDWSDTLSKLKLQLEKLLEDKTIESAREVLATCYCAAIFTYRMDSIARHH